MAWNYAKHARTQTTHTRTHAKPPLIPQTMVCVWSCFVWAVCAHTHKQSGSTLSQRVFCCPWREWKYKSSKVCMFVFVCVYVCACECECESACVCMCVSWSVLHATGRDREPLSAAGASLNPPLCSCEEIKRSSLPPSVPLSQPADALLGHSWPNVAMNQWWVWSWSRYASITDLLQRENNGTKKKKYHNFHLRLKVYRVGKPGELALKQAGK